MSADPTAERIDAVARVIDPDACAALATGEGK